MLTIIILFLTGVVVGAMNAIAGGGMLLGFPIMVALGIPPLAANATTNIITAPGQIASAFGYRTYLRRVPWYYILLLIPIVIGSAGGALLLRSTSAGHFRELVPVLVLFAVGLFALQPLIHFHLHRSLHSKRSRALILVLIALAILPASVYGGYFGAGYGFIMLAFLGLTSLHDAHQINAMKNVAATAVGITGLICLYSSGLIDWRHGLIMAIGTTIGGYTGARLAQRVSTHRMRLAVIVIGVASVAFLAASGN